MVATWWTNDKILAEEMMAQKNGAGPTRRIYTEGGHPWTSSASEPWALKVWLEASRRALIGTGALSLSELSLAGPVAEEPEAILEQENAQYWDDVNGGYLDPDLTRQARNLELEWIKR